MKSIFKLIGLSRPKSFTCETLDSENIFHASSDNMSQETFGGLFNYCKGHWNTKKRVEIEHDGLKDGIPINPNILSITEA